MGKLKEIGGKVGGRGKEEARGFWDFIRSQRVIGFAVGLVIGTAASGLINSLINNVIMPPLGFWMGSSDGLKGLTFDLGTTPTGEQATLHYGVFLSDLVNFLVLAVVVYFVIKWMKLEMRK